MAQNVILLGHDAERSRSFVKVNYIWLSNSHPIHEDIFEVSLRSYRQFFFWKSGKKIG